MKPEEIFRFVNVRPAQKPSTDHIKDRFAAYDAVQKSPFHLAVEQLPGGPTRDKAVELAHTWLTTKEFKTAELQNTVNLIQRATTAADVAQAKEIVKDGLGQPLAAYLPSASARVLRDSTWDRLYAHSLVPEEQPGERDLIYDGVRAFHFLELLARQNDDDAPVSAAELSTVSPIIPKGVIPIQFNADKGLADQYAKEILTNLESVHNRVFAIDAALDDLKNADRKYRAELLLTVAPLVAPSAPGVHPLAATLITEASLAIPHPAEAGAPAENPPPATTVGQEAPVEERTVIVPKRVPWTFEEFGNKNLSQTTIDLLTAQRSKLSELEIAEVIAALEEEKFRLITDLIEGLHPGGIQYVRENDLLKDLLENVSVPGFFLPPIPRSAPDHDPGSANARGIKPLGIGDLLVVKQELLRYVAGEVAHIENVLKSEHKTRIHSRLREVEEIVITETEQIEETEKDLQTTERFELNKESQKTIESQMKFDAGVSVTATYGPVSTTAHADFALSQTSSESNRIASTFAKQITERSLSRIMQRTREERTRRTLERFEEKNEHGFDNKDGKDHVIGIYRWVDKYYKARLINYGRRLMLEFIIPEPAAFYLHLQSSSTVKGVNIQKPAEPMVSGRRLEPTDVTKYNYTYFVAQYNVPSMPLYPPETVWISAAAAKAGSSAGNNNLVDVSKELSVPAGYKCNYLFGLLNWQGLQGTSFFLECFVGGQAFATATGNNLEGVIPISIQGWVAAYHVNMVAVCVVTQEHIKDWQLKAYAAIMEAYQQALANYNEQVSAAQIQAGVQIQGRNPDINRSIERDELKKGVLRMLTNNFAKTRVSGAWRYNEMFNAMEANGQFGYPEFNIDEAMVEGRIVQFFEQAIEWNNVTYRFYPYIWGRKAGWRDIFPLTDTDPQFTEFLRAGSARVIVSVHPSYNETLLHYMATNEIWNGGSPPTMDDPLYIAIVDELKSDAGTDLDQPLPSCAPNSKYPCLADEWQIKLPTTLVYLQKDAVLPDFTEN